MKSIVRVLVAACAIVAMAVPASAQVYTGRIDVTVADSTGAILPGVTVDISGPQSQSAVTDEKGEARFLNLAPGTYVVAAKLQGFGDYLNKNVVVSTGTSANLRVTMGVAGVTEGVSVSAASPVVDTKKTSVTTNVTAMEMQEIPSSRDPWVVLQTVPGVIVDRVNVGGAESGQQSNYQAKGSNTTDNTWSIDGIAITDMAALGSSPGYYDFDMFDEMQIATGGADLRQQTGGVGVNFVLKTGSNRPRGSARYIFTGKDLQGTNRPDDLLPSASGNRMDDFKDYGAEIGGPILRDRLWAWGAAGFTDVTVLTLTGAPDATELKNYSAKVNGQITDDLRATYTLFRNDKQKFGRDAGVTRPAETTWDQVGPTTMNKGELNWVAGNSLFLTGRAANISSGFSLTPQGGLDTAWYTDDEGVNRGSYQQAVYDRPQWAVSADGSWFKGRHEVIFGAGHRNADAFVEAVIPGYGGNAGIHTTHDTYPNMIADIWVPTASATNIKVTHAFVGDTMSWNRLTLNAGLRWDRQSAGVLSTTQAGFGPFSSLLPDLTAPAVEDAIVYNSIAPRVGLTYALNDSRKTIARASYAAFADQIGTATVSFLSTVSDRGLYVYDVKDLNGNKIVDPEEVGGIADCSDTGPRCFPYGFDITNPGATGGSPHTIGEHKTPMTHEFALGLDHELMPNFGISGTFTFRHFNNFNWRHNGVTGEDYEQIGTFTPTAAEIARAEAAGITIPTTPIYGVRADAIPAFPGRTTFQSRPDYYQRYMGFELAATKRLSNRWMGRLGLSTNRHTEYFESLAGMLDPTPTASTQQESGQLVVRASAGSGKSNISQVLPAYQITAMGLYQAPWGINLAANLMSRQGFSAQYNRTLYATTDPLVKNKTISIIDENGEYRLPNVTSLDARVGKEFGIRRVRLNLDLDLFNVLNSATVLGRSYDLRLATGATAFNNVTEIMNPRILRLGLRVNF